jgi:hypothetical protein
LLTTFQYLLKAKGKFREREKITKISTEHWVGEEANSKGGIRTFRVVEMSPHCGVSHIHRNVFVSIHRNV